VLDDEIVRMLAPGASTPALLVQVELAEAVVDLEVVASRG
jgi:hypothetical protein